jgi:hypothetical protein
MAQTDDGFVMILDAEKVFATGEIIDLQNITKDIDQEIHEKT